MRNYFSKISSNFFLCRKVVSRIHTNEMYVYKKLFHVFNEYPPTSLYVIKNIFTTLLYVAMINMAIRIIVHISFLLILV